MGETSFFIIMSTIDTENGVLQVLLIFLVMSNTPLIV
jgi:hypothetical protein